MPRIELERIEEVDDVDQRSSESFDRVAFAERALALVRPPRMVVAVCPGSRRLRVEAGRQWGGSEGERWAVLEIPHDASRAAITRAVLTLGGPAATGDHERAPRPWAFDVLVRSAAAS